MFASVRPSNAMSKKKTKNTNDLPQKQKISKKVARKKKASEPAADIYETDEFSPDMILDIDRSA